MPTGRPRPGVYEYRPIVVADDLDRLRGPLEGVVRKALEGRELPLAAVPARRSDRAALTATRRASAREASAIVAIPALIAFTSSLASSLGRRSQAPMLCAFGAHRPAPVLGSRHGSQPHPLERPGC